MSSTDHLIDRLRAELAGLTGAARGAPLARLGQALLQRSLHVGIVTESALPDLNAAVTALEEALDHARQGDPLRVNVLFLLGFALSTRTNHLNDDRDRDVAIGHLTEALSADRLPPATEAGARVVLGMQYTTRAMAPLASPQSMMSLVAKANAERTAHLADLDRADECFHAVLAGEFVSDDIREMTRTALDMTEAARAMLGVGAGGFDFQKLIDAMGALQRIQERVARQSGPGRGPFGNGDLFSFAGLGRLLTMDPLDYPVAVVEGTAEEVAPEAAPKPAPVEPEQPEPVDLRGSLRERLSLDPAVPVWEAAARLLLPDADVPPVAVVDDAVAMASTVVDEETDGTAEPADAAVDWFLLAVALHLRDRVAGDVGDRRAGADALLTAARTVPADHPAAVVVLRSLGAFLDPDHPLGGVLDAVAAGFAGRFDAVLAAGSVTDPEEWADLHALRCVCRAAWAVAEVGRAVGQVSPGYPWSEPLRAAARSAG